MLYTLKSGYVKSSCWLNSLHFVGRANFNRNSFLFLGLHGVHLFNTRFCSLCKSPQGESSVSSLSHFTLGKQTKAQTQARPPYTRHMLLFMRSRANNPLLFCYHHPKGPHPHRDTHYPLTFQASNRRTTRSTQLVAASLALARHHLIST